MIKGEINGASIFFFLLENLPHLHPVWIYGFLFAVSLPAFPSPPNRCVPVSLPSPDIGSQSLHPSRSKSNLIPFPIELSLGKTRKFILLYLSIQLCGKPFIIYSFELKK
jgi:hypothetical protein